MFEIKNTELAISILDPQTDLNRCGSRYCVGGYLYQVTDAQKGELLSGPQYPAPYPDVFHGQGAPDHFVTVLGSDAPVGGEVAAIGVGRVRRTSPKDSFFARDNPDVASFLPWTVEQAADRITMQASDVFRDWAYQLTRTVTLDGRTVYSHTALENQGQGTLPVRWYAHPFFPLTADRVYCRYSTPMSFPENPGYFLNAENFICQKPDYEWTKGHFLAPEYEKQGNGMTITQRHPLVGEVIASLDFMPDWLPVWSNDRTFSFEPYFIRELAAGEAAAWTIEYRFGR
jgi:hypothetical protein